MRIIWEPKGRVFVAGLVVTLAVLGTGLYFAKNTPLTFAETAGFDGQGAALGMDSPAYDYIHSMIGSAQREGTLAPSSEQLRAFAAYYQNEISDTQRLQIERGWFSAPPTSSADRWFRIVAISSAGLPELAVKYCDQILASEEASPWRELALDAKVTLQLQSVQVTPEDVSDTLITAFAEVPADTYEHMISKVLFCGPKYATGALCSGPPAESKPSDCSRFLSGILTHSTEAVEHTYGYQAYLAYNDWQQAIHSKDGQRCAAMWANWGSIIESMPDGPTRENALTATTKHVFDGLHSGVLKQADLENVQSLLSQISLSSQTPHVTAVAQECAAEIHAFQNEWGRANELRLLAAANRVTPRPKAWLSDSVFDWGKAAEDKASGIFEELHAGNASNAKRLLVDWLRQHPYGPVTLKVYNQAVAPSCEGCTRGVLPVPWGESLGYDIYPPDPVWTGEVLDQVMFICGVPILHSEYDKQAEALVRRINRYASGLVYPQASSGPGASEPLLEIGQAIQAGDLRVVFDALWEAFQLGIIESDGQRLDVAASELVLAMDAMLAKSILEGDAYIPENPRALALLVSLMCAQAGRTDAAAVDVYYDRALSACKAYCISLFDAHRDSVSDVDREKTQAAILPILALLGQRCGAMDETLSFIADSLVPQLLDNPYSAPFVLRLLHYRVRDAVAKSRSDSLPDLLNMYEVTLLSMESADPPSEESESARTCLERVRAFLLQ